MNPCGAVLRVSLLLMFSMKSSAGSAPDEDRVAQARIQRGQNIRDRLRAAGLAYPPGELLIRVFKREGELEVWARGEEEAFRKVATYRMTAQSGDAGPKRQEGDGQIPEGFYAISVFNPKSNFHLSLGLNYPNAADRFFANLAKPGGDIYIHGGAASVGCLAIGDAAIEELYLLAVDTRERARSEIPVHIFPARMSGPSWETYASKQIAANQSLAPFWRNLKAGYDAFEGTHRLCQITVGPDGRYLFGR